MENYLFELIRENNRIIIPNFGAFIVSREKGRNILFNNFLSFNDGLLISHICAVEGVDSATATQKVEDYVAHINGSLDEKGLFEIDGIGQFTKDESGILRFEQSPSESPGIDDADSTKEELPEEEDAFRSTDDSDLLDLDTSGGEEIPTNTPADETNYQPNQPEEPAPYSVGSATVGIPSVQEIDSKTDDISEESSSGANIYINNEERKRPVGLIVLIVLISLLLIGSALWFFTNVLDDFKSSNKQQAVETQQVEEPEMIKEAAQPEEEIGFVEDEVVEEPVVVSTRQHHIIVGSFRDEAKAGEQMQMLINKGYATASILPYKGRYLLSVEWYPSVNKALQRQEELLNELQMENWVLSLTVK
jgi:nucleoid DNA-binding protein